MMIWYCVAKVEPVFEQLIALRWHCLFFVFSIDHRTMPHLSLEFNPPDKIFLFASNFLNFDTGLMLNFAYFMQLHQGLNFDLKQQKLGLNKAKAYIPLYIN
jgi:hypothetical protein